MVKTSSPEAVYRYVGNRLRHFRRARGLKQADLAETLGISTQQYQKYEDARSRCSLGNLLKLAAFFEQDITALLPAEGSAATVRPDGTARVSHQASAAPAAPIAAQAGKLVTAFLEIDDPAARQHILDLAERMRSRTVHA